MQKFFRARSQLGNMFYTMSQKKITDFAGIVEIK